MTEIISGSEKITPENIPTVSTTNEPIKELALNALQESSSYGSSSDGRVRSVSSSPTNREAFALQAVALRDLGAITPDEQAFIQEASNPEKGYEDVLFMRKLQNPETREEAKNIALEKARENDWNYVNLFNQTQNPDEEPLIGAEILQEKVDKEENKKEYLLAVLNVVGSDLIRQIKCPAAQEILEIAPFLGLLRQNNQVGTQESITKIRELAKEIQTTTYLHRSETNTSFSAVVDPKSKTVFILTQKQGSFSAEGTSKKVTDAVEFSIDTNKTTRPIQWARLVNTKGHEINPTELALQQRVVGDIRLIVHYKSHSSPQVEKVSAFVQKYDGPVHEAQSITSQLLVSSAEDLLKLHQMGFAHKDVKCENVLLKDNKTATRLTDYGHAFSSKEKKAYPQKVKGHYGTRAYTAPELLKGKTSHGLFETEVTRAKREDMFAYGCMLYELLHAGNNVPWYDACQNGDSENARKIQGQCYNDLCQEAKSETDGERKKLLEITIKLLDPDPKKRLTCQELVTLLKK